VRGGEKRQIGGVETECQRDKREKERGGRERDSEKKGSREGDIEGG
jgi:hypothetical protein